MRRNDICDKLSQSRCMREKTIPKEAFDFSVYIANHFYGDIFNETDLALVVAKILEDKNSQVNKDAAQYLPLIVDQLFSTDFAETFREICSRVFGYNPPRLLKKKNYPKYVRVATKWWADEVLRPSLEGIPHAFARTRRKFSEYEEALFRQTLAHDIIIQVAENNSCYISCDWSPSEILGRAGKKLGIDPLVGYPSQRIMVVFREQLRVSRSGDTEFTIIDLKKIKATEVR